MINTCRKFPLQVNLFRSTYLIWCDGIILGKYSMYIRTIGGIHKIKIKGTQDPWLEELSRDEPDPSNPVHDTSPPNHVMLLQENGVFQNTTQNLNSDPAYRVIQNSTRNLAYSYLNTL